MCQVTADAANHSLSPTRLTRMALSLVLRDAAQDTRRKGAEALYFQKYAPGQPITTRIRLLFASEFSHSLAGSNPSRQPASCVERPQSHFDSVNYGKNLFRAQRLSEQKS